MLPFEEIINLLPEYLWKIRNFIQLLDLFFPYTDRDLFDSATVIQGVASRAQRYKIIKGVPATFSDFHHMMDVERENCPAGRDCTPVARLGENRQAGLFGDRSPFHGYARSLGLLIYPQLTAALDSEINSWFSAIYRCRW